MSFFYPFKRINGLTISFLLIYELLTAQPSITDVGYPDSMSKFNKFEICFTLNTYFNPYDPQIIDVYAEFVESSGKVYRQNAFFFEEYIKNDSGVDTIPEDLSATGYSCWKVRFAPPETGKWEFRIIAKDNIGTTTYPNNGYINTDCVESENLGFISIANKRYLKFSNGTPYYPIGNSLPWFNRNPWRGEDEYGTNEIKAYIDEMADNGVDFFRFEINNLSALNIMGWDLTTHKNYCRFFNQRDSWQLDEIVDYSAEKKMNILFAVFAHAYLGDNGVISYYLASDGNYYSYSNINSEGDTIPGYCHGAWSLFHPFNDFISTNHVPEYPDTKLNLQNPYEWYYDTVAINQQMNLLRYIIARWGYSTNLFGFELMDEADRIDYMNNNDLHPNHVPVPAGSDMDAFNQSIIDWHIEMSNYLKSIDPYSHLITTAYADMHHPTANEVYNHMDFTQIHFYTDYGTELFEDHQDYYFTHTQEYHDKFNRPHMIGEHNYIDYSNIDQDDPHLYNLHDNLWATMHNGSMAPASFWRQNEISQQSATSVYVGISRYAKSLPPFSENHRPHMINNDEYRIFYLNDINQDEYYGWVQDKKFTFRNLFGTDYLQTLEAEDRPTQTPTDISFTLNVSRNGIFHIYWYNTTSGELEETQTVNCLNNQIILTLPTTLKHNIHADGAFIVEYQCESSWNTTVLNDYSPANVRPNSSLGVSDNNQVNYIGSDSKINQMYWNGYYWQHAVLDASAPPNVRFDSDLAIDIDNNVYFISNDNRIHRMYWKNGSWNEEALNDNSPQNVREKSALCVYRNTNVFFIGNDNRVHVMYKVDNVWREAVLNSRAPQNVMQESDLAVDQMGRVYFVANDFRIHQYYWNGKEWIETALNKSAPQNVRVDVIVGYPNNYVVSRSPLVCYNSNSVFFVADDNRVHNYYWNVSYWQEATLQRQAPSNVNLTTSLALDKSGVVYFVANDNRVHRYFWSNNSWHENVNNELDPMNVSGEIACDGNDIFYTGTDQKIWSSYYGCSELFKDSEFSIKATFDKTQSTLGANEIKLYPNPNNGNFTLYFEKSFWNQNLIIEIFNASFNRLLQVNTIVDESNADILIDISGEANGIYLIKITSESGSYVKKIFKQ